MPDSNLIVYLTIIASVLICVFFVIFRKLFKLSSTIKLVFMSIIITILVIIALAAIYSVANNEFEYLNVEKYSISGKVQSLNGDTIIIYVTSTTNDKIKGNVKLKVNDTTAFFSQKDSSNLVRISMKEIIPTNKVEVTCSYDKSHDIITAIKIVVK